MKKIVIIGNSAAAISCVEAIRVRDKESKISLISDEAYPAYCRCLISSLLAGDTTESKIGLRDKYFYEKNNVEAILGKKVVKLDPKKRVLTLAENERIGFDIALVATGARPKFPEIKGIKKKGVSGFRTLDDTKEIITIATFAKCATILGGGLIGLKAASALRKRGLDVRVIIKSAHVLSQVLDGKGASIVGHHLENQGIEILTGQEAVEIIGNGQVKAIKLDSGKVIESAIVIVGKGVKPNMELVKESPINSNFGILTNEYLETSAGGIFAAGDVAECFDIVRGEPYINALWPNAVEQGKVAGANISGGRLTYSGSLAMNAVDFFGLGVITAGLKKEDENCEVLTSLDDKGASYKKFIIKDAHLVGFIGVGKIKNSGIFLRLIREKIDITPIKNVLLDDSFSYAKVIDLFAKDEIYSNLN